MNAETMRNVNTQYATITRYNNSAKAKVWVYGLLSRGREAAKHGEHSVTMTCKKPLVREAKSTLIDLGYKVTVTRGLFRTTITARW